MAGRQSFTKKWIPKLSLGIRGKNKKGKALATPRLMP
jgi:hypothetical protein